MSYKFIFVILSSSYLEKTNAYYNSSNKYQILKDYNKIYFDMFKNDIKFFFIEYNKDISEDVLEVGDFIYVKGLEDPMVPNMLIKNVKAINYINSKYNYDYIIRSNLSTFWNIPVLFSLYNNIPRNNLFGGHYIFNSFITGTGIIISKNIVPILLKIDPMSGDNDDVAISHFMKSKNIRIFHLEKSNHYKMNYQILDENVTDINSPHHKNHNLEINETTNTDDILYFRIRNASQERDLLVTKKILKKLYNIVL
jgi:hypothetical protein